MLWIRRYLKLQKKYGQRHRQELVTFQDHSRQIPIQMMTILLFQDHYCSNPSHQVGSKERRLPQNVLRANKCKKGKGALTDSVQDETNATLSFLKQRQEKDEQFMAKVMEMEQQARETQQKFSLEALSMLGNILKDIAKTKE